MKVSSFQIRNGKWGFTLVELLVVITVFALLLIVANQILFSAFRGSSKSEATTKVKREGERVLAIMERSLRSSRAIVSCTGTQVTYQDLSGVNSTFACSGVGSGSGVITQGATALTVTDVDVSSCSFVCESIGGVTKVVNIAVSFAAKASASSPRVEERGNISFQTRVVLRN